MQQNEKKQYRPALRPLLCGVSAIVLTAGSFAARSGDNTDLAESFTTDTIVIEAAANACYLFDVYLAVTSAQQRRGLMHVRELPNFTGMLFVYGDSAIHSLWMKNTYIPLDILFMRADGTVASIARDTEPLSLTSIPSAEPVRYVLELNAGVTEELGINPGSRIHIPPAAR